MIAIIVEIMTLLLRAPASQSVDLYLSENYGQLAIVYVWLQSLPGGEALLRRVMGEVPCLANPSAIVPSNFHSNIVGYTLDYLNRGHPPEEQFTIFNEFAGLPNFIFPIDAAVYDSTGRLFAFIEIDGMQYHYRSGGGQQLRRKNALKASLYQHYYPNIPTFRIRSDQVEIIGVERASFELANWILSLAGKPPMIFT